MAATGVCHSVIYKVTYKQVLYVLLYKCYYILYYRLMMHGNPNIYKKISYLLWRSVYILNYEEYDIMF